MLLSTGLILLALGAAVWLFGDRMWLLGAGAGALLGFGLFRLFPGLADGTAGLLVVIGLAVLLGVLAFMGKAFIKIIVMVIGFVIGGGLALNLLGMFDVGTGTIDWLISIIAGFIVALIFARFLNWALIIFAALLGSMLLVRGGMVAFPDLLSGTTGTIAVLALTAVGIWYHYRKERPAAPAATAPAQAAPAQPTPAPAAPAPAAPYQPTPAPSSAPPAPPAAPDSPPPPPGSPTP